MSHDWNDFEAALKRPTAAAARLGFCRESADGLLSCGNVLWCFGLETTPYRRAVAIVSQMAGCLGQGAVSMLEVSNWYAAASLIRQLVETEYLFFLFADDPDEARAWLSSDPAELRRKYSPQAMRNRSGGRFRDSEYWTHCDIGGHPHPRAHFLLPENVLPSGRPLSSSTGDWMWVDLGQHLERASMFLGKAVLRENLAQVNLVSQWLPRMIEAVSGWHRQDPCADRFHASVFGKDSGEAG